MLLLFLVFVQCPSLYRADWKSGYENITARSDAVGTAIRPLGSHIANKVRQGDRAGSGTWWT